jgi:hypothetical protein
MDVVKILTYILVLVVSSYIPLNSKDWTFFVNTHEIRMESSSVRKTSLWFKEKRDAMSMSNLSFFTTKTFVGPYKDTSILSYKNTKRWPVLYLSNSNVKILKWNEIPNFNYSYMASGYPLLIHGGEKQKIYNTHFARRNCSRTAVGIMKNGNVLIFISSAATLKRLQDKMYELGCQSVLNLDGGSSTFVYINGKEEYSSNKGNRYPNVLIWKTLPIK